MTKELCQIDGCQSIASYSRYNYKYPTHCPEHKTRRTIFQWTILCENKSCDRYANFGTDKQSRCNLHKKTTDNKFNNPICIEKNCWCIAKYGHDHSARCYIHKLPTDRHMKQLCAYENCTKGYNYGAKGAKEHCKLHCLPSDKYRKRNVRESKKYDVIHMKLMDNQANQADQANREIHPVELPPIIIKPKAKRALSPIDMKEPIEKKMKYSVQLDDQSDSQSRELPSFICIICNKQLFNLSIKYCHECLLHIRQLDQVIDNQRKLHDIKLILNIHGIQLLPPALLNNQLNLSKNILQYNNDQERVILLEIDFQQMLNSLRIPSFEETRLSYINQIYRSAGYKSIVYVKYNPDCYIQKNGIIIPYSAERHEQLVNELYAVQFNEPFVEKKLFFDEH